MALLDNNKDILPLSSISEVLTTKVRTLKMYEEKGLLPLKQENKKLYSINDVKIVAFVHYLASAKKINTNGIKYIIDILNNNMSENNKDDFLNLVEQRMGKLSGFEVKDIDII